MIDLIGKPGNFHNPDSSINGDILSPVPSPFQSSHIKDVQQVYVGHTSISDVKSTHVPTKNTLHSGITYFVNVKHQCSFFIYHEMPKHDW